MECVAFKEKWRMSYRLAEERREEEGGGGRRRVEEGGGGRRREGGGWRSGLLVHCLKGNLWFES